MRCIAKPEPCSLEIVCRVKEAISWCRAGSPHPASNAPLVPSAGGIRRPRPTFFDCVSLLAKPAGSQPEGAAWCSIPRWRDELIVPQSLRPSYRLRPGEFPLARPVAGPVHPATLTRARSTEWLRALVPAKPWIPVGLVRRNLRPKKRQPQNGGLAFGLIDGLAEY